MKAFSSSQAIIKYLKSFYQCYLKHILDKAIYVVASYLLYT